MNRQEKIKFLSQELQGLWPDWQPSEAETGAWMGILSNYDYGPACTAIKQHWAGNKTLFRRPKPADFIEKVKVLLQNSKRQKVKNVAPETDVFIRCIENDECPGRIGWEVGIFVGAERQKDHDYVMRVAENMRKSHETMYFGHWITDQRQLAGHLAFFFYGVLVFLLSF